MFQGFTPNATLQRRARIASPVLNIRQEERPVQRLGVRMKV